MIIPENLMLHNPDKKLLKIINSKVFNDKILYEKETTFHNIKVVENEIGKFLHYGDTYQAGIINTDYYKGNLPYINYFLLPYFYKKSVKNVLLIGLGSGQIVHDLFKLYSTIEKFDIVDIDEEILSIAQTFFNFKMNSHTNFYLQDAIAFLKQNKRKYDLIIVDVAGNEGIDERFIEQEYFNLINKNLKKSGIFVSNLCSSFDLEHPKNKFYKKIKDIYCKNFNSIKIFRGNYSDKIYYKCFFDLNERVLDITNLIIFASKSEINFLQNFDEKLRNFIIKFNNINIKDILSDEIKQCIFQDN